MSARRWSMWLAAAGTVLGFGGALLLTLHVPAWIGQASGITAVVCIVASLLVWFSGARMGRS